MSENTGIEWTDNTFNPWWGCTSVSPACDNCYAKAIDARFHQDAHWDNGAYKTLTESNWAGPAKWQRKAEKTGIRTQVFCASMGDWADNNAPSELRARLFDVIRATPNLDWQLLTKRAPNIKRLLPADWGDGWDNVWLGVTVEDCKHGLPRIEHLRQVPAKLRFLSIEPLLEDLGSINLSGIDWVIVGGESGPGCRAMDTA